MHAHTFYTVRVLPVDVPSLAHAEQVARVLRAALAAVGMEGDIEVGRRAAGTRATLGLGGRRWRPDQWERFSDGLQ
jgi:hypothetical protein